MVLYRSTPQLKVTYGIANSSLFDIVLIFFYEIRMFYTSSTQPLCIPDEKKCRTMVEKALEVK